MKVIVNLKDGYSESLIINKTDNIGHIVETFAGNNSFFIIYL